MRKFSWCRWTTVGAKVIAAEVSLGNRFGDGSKHIKPREKPYLGGEKHMDGPQGFDVLTHTHFILISKVSMIPEFGKVEIPEMLREPF